MDYELQIDHGLSKSTTSNPQHVDAWNTVHRIKSSHTNQLNLPTR